MFVEHHLGCTIVHGLGQPEKPSQTHLKNPKMWAGLDNWASMVLKMKNP